MYIHNVSTPVDVLARHCDGAGDRHFLRRSYPATFAQPAGYAHPDRQDGFVGTTFTDDTGAVVCASPVARS